MKKVIFVGAGEYAESVYDSMAKEEYDLIGFVDEYKKGHHMGKPILAATIEEVFNFRDYAYFISIGDTEPRKRQFEAVKRLGLETINIIDKTALISDSVKIGTGNFIGKMAVINIGRFDEKIGYCCDTDAVLQELLKNRIILKPKYLCSHGATDVNSGGNSQKTRNDQIASFELMKHKWGKYFDYQLKTNKIYVRVRR